MSVDLIGLCPMSGDYILPDIPENTTSEDLGDYMHVLHDYVQTLPGAHLTLPEADWNLLTTLLNQIQVIKQLDLGDVFLGVENPDDCEELSKHLSRHINFLEAYNYDRIYMKTGNWYTFDNNPISNSDLIEELNTLTPTFFVMLPVIGQGVVEYHPECSLKLDDLKRFHSFLETCGGFMTNLNKY